MISCNGFVVKRYPFALGFCELQSDSQLEQRVAAEQGADETAVVLQRLVYLSKKLHNCDGLQASSRNLATQRLRATRQSSSTYTRHQRHNLVP